MQRSKPWSRPSNRQYISRPLAVPVSICANPYLSRSHNDLSLSEINTVSKESSLYYKGQNLAREMLEDSREDIDLEIVDIWEQKSGGEYSKRKERVCEETDQPQLQGADGNAGRIIRNRNSAECESEVLLLARMIFKQLDGQKLGVINVTNFSVDKLTLEVKYLLGAILSCVKSGRELSQLQFEQEVALILKDFGKSQLQNIAEQLNMRKLSPRKMSHPIIVEETGRKLKEVGVVDKVANKLSLLESKINNCLARNHKQKLPNPYNRLGVEETQNIPPKKISLLQQISPPVQVIPPKQVIQKEIVLPRQIIPPRQIVPPKPRQIIGSNQVNNRKQQNFSCFAPSFTLHFAQLNKHLNLKHSSSLHITFPSSTPRQPENEH